MIATNAHYTLSGRVVAFADGGTLTILYSANAQEIVRDGVAWRYPQYDKPGEFIAAEADAREQQRGLWADPHPLPPWEFRRAKREAAHVR